MKKTDKIRWDSSMVATVVFFGVLSVYPLFASGFSVLNLTSFMYQMLLAASLVLTWGYCGLFSFAQAAFYGLGGYCYGIIALNLQQNALTPLAMVLSVLFGFAVAGIFGYFLFYGKVNDSFLGVITLCFTLIGETFLQQTADPKWKIGKVALNGFNGINKIPPLTIGNYPVTGTAFYYVVLATILIVLVAFKVIEKHSMGYAMFALGENTHRSSLLGYDASKIKTLVFAAGGGIAALAGVYYTMWGGYIVPTSMNMTSATVPIVLAAAGGRKNPIAVYLFALIYLKFAQAMAANGTQYAYVVLGAILILVVLLVPNGIIDTGFQAIDGFAGRLRQKGSKEGGRG